MFRRELFFVIGLGLFGGGMALAEEKKLVDFKKVNPELRMGITDDGVMGGLSKGTMKKTDEGTLLFKGMLSLENNGGFSSLRMKVGPWDLSEWKGLALQVKGDGRTYKLRATTDERYRGSDVSFQGEFTTKKGEWVTVKVPFEKLKAGWRGMKLKTEFDAAKIEGMGIVLADKKPGEFQLEVKSISAWK